MIEPLQALSVNGSLDLLLITPNFVLVVREELWHRYLEGVVGVSQHLLGGVDVWFGFTTDIS